MKIAFFVILVLTVLVLAIGSGAVFYKIYKLEKVVFPQLTEQDQAAIDLFIEDQEAVAEHPFFQNAYQEKNFTKDASVFLNKKVYWSGLKKDLKDPLKLPDSIDDALTLYAWIFKFDRFSHLKLDFKWMKTLKGFDHWNLETESPLSASYEGDSDIDVHELPYPDSQFSKWAQLRLIFAVNLGSAEEIEDAFAEVRHLAHILLTTEDFTLGLHAIKILTVETRAYGYLEKENLHPNNWTPIEIKLLGRAKNTLFGMANFFGIYTDAKTLELVFGEPDHRAGICAGISGGFSSARLAKLWLSDSYSNRINKLASTLDTLKDHCRLKIVRAIWNNSQYRPNSLKYGSIFKIIYMGDKQSSIRNLKLKSEANGEWKVINTNPILKKFIGLHLNSIALPDYLTWYYNQTSPSGSDGT